MKEIKQLNKDSLKNFLNELYEFGCQNIYLSGGEPLKYPDLFSVLKNVNHKMKICLVTNATLINEAIIDELSEYVDCFQISLDGSETENDLIRGNGSYLKAIKSIRIIKERNKPVNIHTVLLSNNLNYIEDFIMQLKNLGVDRITFTLLNPIGRAKNNQELIDRDCKTISKINNLFNKLAEREGIIIDALKIPCGPCPINDESQPLNLRVDYYGYIYICQRFATNQLFSLGNIDDHSLKSVLISNEFENIKQLIELSTKYVIKCKNRINEEICSQPCPADIINSSNMFDYTDNYCDERTQIGSKQ